MKFHIGTSGWSYRHWEQGFYPDDMEADKLEYFSKQFSTVEINNSFYQLPDFEIFDQWRQQTASSFRFSVKVNRYITHMKNLKGCRQPVREMLAHARHLQQKLGPILFQLSSRWRVDQTRLENFISQLPTDYRYAFEFRHDSWYEQPILSLLKKNNIALVIHDHQDAPSPFTATADWVYVRLHGPEGNYRSAYNPDQLKQWANDVSSLDQISEAFIYFNNDAQANAVHNACQLKKIVK